MKKREEHLRAMELSAGMPEADSAESLPQSGDVSSPAGWPALLRLQNGKSVQTREDWALRRQEILRVYQCKIYGQLPDASGLRVSYTLKQEETPSARTLAVAVTSRGRSTSFSVLVSLPAGSAPEAGWPCYLEYAFIRNNVRGASPNCMTAASRGYAGITYVPTDVAEDSGRHIGAFYGLYPYQPENGSFPGVLAVWAWGVSRVLDALEAGAGREFGIDPARCIVAGVSRYGKSAAVAGAYDPRIRVTVPSCSGAGGVTLFRTDNHGKTYDLSSLGGPSAWTNESVNEPLSNLQGGEGYWFCGMLSALFRERKASRWSSICSVPWLPGQSAISSW